MFKLAGLLERDADRIAEIETTDNGKVIRETQAQMRFAARNYRFHAGFADKLTGETKQVDNPNLFDYTTREPIGVAALITAWNSPMGLLGNKLAPALAAGNCVVIKPSEYTSVSTLEFARLVEEAGFPPGVVNVITGAGEAGSALTADPRLGRISFTGSVATGIQVAISGAKNVVPVTLELGGKSANIIFDDADVRSAINGAVAGIFAAAGQTCIAGSRLLVHASHYEQVVEAMVARANEVVLGDPLNPATEMGPVAHRGQWEAILHHIERARNDGAEIVAGGHSAEVGHGLFVQPTVIARARNDMEIAQEEVFGPVVVVIPFESEDEAIAIANDSPFGLAAGVWTQNLARAHRVAAQLQVGQVWINTYRVQAAQAPFGGTKRSGYGRERGIEAIDEYLRIKNTMIDLSDEQRDPFAIKT
jgi:aldehyde dehydrogenase (NAD+)